MADRGARSTARPNQARWGAHVHCRGEFLRLFQPFRDRLSQLGWAEPRNIRIDYRWANNNPDLGDTYARELVGFAPDAMFAAPGPAVEMLQRLTRTIPVVFVTSTDPVRAGYVASYARPGGNITGFTQFENTLNTKFPQLLKDVAPQTSHVAMLNLVGVARARRDFAIVEGAASALGLAPVDMLVKDDPADIERAIAAFARKPNGGLIVPPDNRTQKHHVLIVALAARHRLPAVYYNRLFTDAGGLMSYGADQRDIFGQAASYVDRILRGAKPSELPVQAPTRFELVINLNTAKALGLNVPNGLLLAADELIQ